MGKVWEKFLWQFKGAIFMDMIVAADQNWGIGKENDLLAKLPEDMKFFRKKTMGSVLIMGKRTLESFPGGKPLPGRIHLVLTRNQDFSMEGVIVCHNISEVFEKLKEYEDKEVFVAGGASVYKQFLTYCKKAYVTRIQSEFEADTYISNLDEDKNWELTQSSAPVETGGHSILFTTYERKDDLLK